MTHRSNRFSGTCAVCGTYVAKLAGVLEPNVSRTGAKWRVLCQKCAKKEAWPEDQAEPPKSSEEHEPTPKAPATSEAPVAAAGIDWGRVREIARDQAKKVVDGLPPMPEPAPLEIIVKSSERPAIKLDGPFHPALPKIVTLLGAHCNVWLVGPAGCGKTTIAEQSAQALGLDFYFTGAIGAPFELTGYQDANGRLIRTQFRDAFENGGLFLFDEVDASDPRALLRFNAALANGWADFPDGKVAKHKDFRVIAAANTYGAGADRVYVGRAQLDGATLDRFAYLPMDYDEGLERALGQEAWAAYVQRVRKEVRALKLRHIVSTRAVLSGSALLAAGVEQTDVAESVLWRGLDSDARVKVEAALGEGIER